MPWYVVVVAKDTKKVLWIAGRNPNKFNQSMVYLTFHNWVTANRQLKAASGALKATE